MGSLDLIINEINPRKDMVVVERSIGLAHTGNNTLANDLKIDLLRLYVFMKPLIRGGTLGAGLGALTSLITNSNINDCIEYGFFTGAAIDAVQLVSRMYAYSKRISK